MINFRATHRTRAGVEVARSGPCNYVCIVGLDTIGVACNDCEFDALFEPIPKPATVTIPLDAARVILDTARMLDPAYVVVLRDAIRVAEREVEYPDNER